MKCFYHSADLDGHCSGALVKRFFPLCEMVGINYGQEFPWDSIEKGERVFMVDFSLQPFTDMIKLRGMCDLTWVDHHETAISDARKHDFIVDGKLAIGIAGCELVWRYLYPADSVPRAVYLLGRYDVWDHGDEDTLPFQYGMRQYTNTLPDNTGFWEEVLTHKYLWEKIADTGRTLLSYEAAQNEKFCRAYSFETNFNGFTGICANRGFTNSQVFDSVYDPEKHHMMITFCRLKLPAKKWTVSLYSTRNDVDCGAIAKSFGGGGHKGAAGFQCDNLPFDF